MSGKPPALTPCPQGGLAGFERSFAQALRSADPAAAPVSFDAPARHRFKVYRNNFFHGLMAQLAAAYPAVQARIGDAAFGVLARTYLAADPPRERSLALFGAGFAAFVDKFAPLSDRPFLGDLARLERAWLEALHAADRAVLEPAALEAAGETLMSCRLVVHPATRLVRAGASVLDHWREVRNEPRDGLPSQAAILVTRPSVDVMAAGLTPAFEAAIADLIGGSTIEDALTTGFERDPKLDVQALFTIILANGAFARLEPSPSGD